MRLPGDDDVGLGRLRGFAQCLCLVEGQSLWLSNKQRPACGDQKAASGSKPVFYDAPFVHPSHGVVEASL